MKYNQNFNGEMNWIIEEEIYDSMNVKKTESIMCIGNGFIGSRCANEETMLHTQRDTFINGTFMQGSGNEVAELPNIADVFGNVISINGKVVNFNSGIIINYSKQLNLYNGEVSRFIKWENNEGIIIDFIFKRFISLEKENVACQKIEIKADATIEVQIESVIDAQVTNSGTQLFGEGEKRFYEDFKFMELLQGNKEGDPIIVINCGHNINLENELVPKIERRKMSSIFSCKVKENQTLSFEKIVTFDVYLDSKVSLNEFRDTPKQEIKTLTTHGYDYLFNLSAKEWKNYWEEFDIEIQGDDYALLGYRFAMYHSRIFTPYNNEKCNIGAKGLSGQGYKGHTFWDTEIFLLPMYIFKQPNVARNLVKYRYHGLQAAKVLGDEFGGGARFPWEATKPEWGDATPKYGAVDIVTGEQQRIWTGDIELHVTSDVIYGLWLYSQITSDDEFLELFGYEMIFETANFWVSRGELIDGVIEINNVIGPDEYKEHINNNAFTNYMAKWNCELALKYIKNVIDAKYVDDISKWDEFVAKIKLQEPNIAGIIPQDDTYLGLKEIDLTKYKNQDNVAEIMKDYSMKQVSEIQVSKQADILILFLLREELFSKDIKKLNFDYYESKTLHDSSLSLSTHVVLASDLGYKNLAYDLFLKAINIDMSPNMKSSDEGIHAASFGGVWQSIYYGFAGIRFVNGKLRIEPNLPTNWESLKLSIYFKGSKVNIEINHSNFSVSCSDNISFIYKEQEHQVQNCCKVFYE